MRKRGADEKTLTVNVNDFLKICCKEEQSYRSRNWQRLEQNQVTQKKDKTSDTEGSGEQWPEEGERNETQGTFGRRGWRQRPVPLW